jgi:diguanylate cyclase (GGDEF)-like protein/PAS domain S-box-containing protein
VDATDDPFYRPPVPYGRDPYDSGESFPHRSRIVLGATLAAALAAIVVLVGWHEGAPGVARLGLGGRPLTPATALTILAIVAGYWAGQVRLTRPLAVVLGAAIALAMGTALIATISGGDWALDDRIAAGALTDAHMSGRPSPQAAVMFLLLGLAVVMRTVPWGRLPAEIAAAVAALVAVAGVIGLVFGWEGFFAVEPRYALSPLAALGVLAACVAIVDPVRGAIRRAPASLTWFVGSLALGLTIITTFSVAHHARVKAHDTQRADLRLASEATRAATTPVLSALDGLATLYSATGAIPDAQLTLAARKVLRGGIVSLVAVLREVPQSRRRAFERHYGTIVKPGGGAHRQTRHKRYTVVMTSRTFRLPALSPPGTYVDVGAEQDRAPSLRRAVRAGVVVASPPIRALRGTSSVIALYLPVRRLTGRQSLLRVAALLDTKALARTVESALPSGVDAQLSDGRRSFDGSPVHAPDGDHRSTVHVAGRDWTVHIDPIRADRAGVVAAFGVGLSMTMLLMLGVGLLVRRERNAIAVAVSGLEERDAAASAAEQARRRSRFLEESATDVLWLGDPQHRFTYVSPAARTLLAREPAELIGRTTENIVHPDDAYRTSRVLDQLATTDTVLSITHRVQHRDGHWLWVETLMRAVRHDLTGEFVQIQGSSRDVTIRRETELRLREAENRFRSAFDEAPMGMAVVALDGQVLQANRALVTLTGEDAPTLRGMTFDALLHQADADTHRQAREALLDGDLQDHDAELRVVQPSGHVVWTLVSTALVLGGEGEAKHYLVQMQDVSERRRAETQLQFLADHDLLTGLLNRRAFERSLREHLTRVRRYGVGGAVLVLNLDGFDALNARIGRGRGDEAIADVARALRRRLRDSDLIARFGGDGFAVLLPHAELQDALNVGSALVDAVGTVEVDGERGVLTASVGVALVDRPEIRGDDLLIDADLAMYDAKQAGRGRVQQSLNPIARPRRIRPTADLANQIREALDEDRMVLYAEPVVDLESGATVQLELALRLRTRDGDLQAPASFLPADHHHELVRELDRWTVARAVALLAAHPDGPTAGVRLSVHSLGEELIDLLADQLTTHMVDPRRLTIVLGEHDAAAHLPLVQELARDLEHLGCPLALDDFGGGFGSFFYLKHLPFDVLKIDGGFVRHCADEHGDQLVIGAMVDLAVGAGARTVGKFVADQAALETLRSIGVDAGQGEFFGAAMPAEQAFSQVTEGRDGREDPPG